MTRMSMRERHEKIDELVQQDPRVQNCANEFNNAQSAITEWHMRNNTLCATKAELNELADLLAYSEFCLESLKCAKNAAYRQLMEQYPNVWNTCCNNPFTADTQDDVTETGTETEEMEEVPTPTPLIRADKFMELIDNEQDVWESTIRICTMWGMDTSSMRARLEVVRRIRAQFERLIDEAKETHNASH